MKLSVIIPCYNEEKTLEEIFNKVNEFNKFEIEIIIIDDCSSDGTANIINNLKTKNPSL